jgi:hypothetical protein
MFSKPLHTFGRGPLKLGILQDAFGSIALNLYMILTKPIAILGYAPGSGLIPFRRLKSSGRFI